MEKNTLAHYIFKGDKMKKALKIALIVLLGIVAFIFIRAAIIAIF